MIRPTRPTMEPSAILNSVDRYYSAKLEAHGPTPAGVDWNGSSSQECRFEQLLRVIDSPGPFVINDYGCGYGALVDFLTARSSTFTYCGFDISGAMIQAAENRYASQVNCRWTSDASAVTAADFTVASGIFNVKLESAEQSW